MKRLALVLMLLMLPSMAWANTTILECTAPGGTVEGDRYIEMFVWGGEHNSWSAVEGWKKNEGWRVGSFNFWPYGISVNLKHIETGRTKQITFNNWICRSVLLEEDD